MTPEQQLRALARCVPVRDSSYCILFGLGGAQPDYAALARELTAPETDNETTGDLSLKAWLRQRLAMGDQERLEAELAEVAAVA